MALLPKGRDDAPHVRAQHPRKERGIKLINRKGIIIFRIVNIESRVKAKSAPRRALRDTHSGKGVS